MCHITSTLILDGRYQVCSCGQHLWSTTQARGLKLGPHTKLTTAGYSQDHIAHVVAAAAAPRASTSRKVVVASYLFFIWLAALAMVVIAAHRAALPPAPAQWRHCQLSAALDTASRWIEEWRDMRRRRADVL